MISVVGCTEDTESIGIITVIASDGRSVDYKTEQLESKFAQVKDLTLAKIFNITTSQKAAVFLANGQIIDCFTNTSVNIKKGSIYLDGNRQAGIIGVVAQPPESRITDVASIARESIVREQPILIIYLDGLGYDKYLQAQAQGLLPNISKLSVPIKSMTVFPPITPVAFAAMITGQTPDKTGIINRDGHELGCISIFDEVVAVGKRTLLVEGDISILNINSKTLFNTDQNKDGIDDDIFMSAIHGLDLDNYHLVLVHFHSIDDMGHTFGPNAYETDNQIKTVDQYVGELLQKWVGTVVVTSDHGMHHTGDQERLGHHGEFKAEDLFVPLVVGEVGT